MSKSKRLFSRESLSANVQANPPHQKRACDPLIVQSGVSDLISDWQVCALGRGLYPDVSVDWLVDGGSRDPLADTDKHSAHDDDGQRRAESNGYDDND